MCFRTELDECLLKAFTLRVREAGISLDARAGAPYNKSRWTV